MTRELTDTERELLAAEHSTDEYRDFLAGILEHSGISVAQAQAALNDAERSRRVDAVIAVRAGFGKTATANKLGISRPTLDAWIKAVESEPSEMKSVLDHELFVARRLHKAS